MGLCHASWPSAAKMRSASSRARKVANMPAFARAARVYRAATKPMRSARGVARSRRRGAATARAPIARAVSTAPATKAMGARSMPSNTPRGLTAFPASRLSNTHRRIQNPTSQSRRSTT